MVLISSANSNIALKDNTGAIAYSDIVTVQASTDNGCLNGTSSNISSPPNTNTGSTPTNSASSRASSVGSGT